MFYIHIHETFNCMQMVYGSAASRGQSNHTGACVRDCACT